MMENMVRQRLIAKFIEIMCNMRAELYRFIEDKNWGLEKNYILEVLDSEIIKYKKEMKIEENIEKTINRFRKEVSK